MNHEIIIMLIAVMTVLGLITAKFASFRRFAEVTSRRRGADHIECERGSRYRLPNCFAIGKKGARHSRDVQASERETTKKGKPGIAMMLLPSILGIGICLFCVCGTTWAWLSADVQTSQQQINSAYYAVTVDSVSDGTSTLAPSDGGSYTLEAKAYTVTLTASGTAMGGGYCLIENADKSVTYYTQTFKPGESITISFTPTAGQYTFTGVWGNLPEGVSFISKS